MGLTDERIAEVYRKTQSYQQTGDELGQSRQNIERRVLRMRANGVDLPSVKRQRALSKEAKTK